VGIDIARRPNVMFGQYSGQTFFLSTGGLDLAGRFDGLGLQL
jgi:hypothetical protein